MCVHYQERTGAYNVLISPIWSNKTEPFSNAAQDLFWACIHCLYHTFRDACQ